MLQPKLKICHIITSVEVGGAEKLLFDLFSKNNPRAHSLSLITVVKGGRLAEKFKQFLYPLFVHQKKMRLGLLIFWQIYRQLKKIKPDIVHTHLFAADFWGIIAAWLARVPVIISTEHNTNQNIEEFEKPFRRWLKIIVFQKCHKIIAISQGVRNYLITELKVPAKKIVLIYNGVNDQQYRAGPAIKKIQRIGIFGRLCPQKGQLDALNALLLVSQKLQIDFYGDGPDLIQLRQKAQQISQHQIFFHSVVSPEMVSEKMRAVDLVLIPSRWEGLSLVAIEAGLCARSIVATDIPGLNEVVINQKTGWLVPPRNPAALAQMIDFLLQHTELANSYGQAARTRALQIFALNDMIKKYCTLYADLTNK